jgi:hypothetical protein
MVRTWTRHAALNSTIGVALKSEPTVRILLDQQQTPA